MAESKVQRYGKVPITLSFLKKKEAPGAIIFVAIVLSLLRMLCGLVSLFTNVIEDPLATRSVTGLKLPFAWKVI